MISLSPAEREIMEVIWDSDGMTNNNIVVHFCASERRERSGNGRRPALF